MFSFSLQLHCTIDSENAQGQNFALIAALVATVATVVLPLSVLPSQPSRFQLAVTMVTMK